MATSLDYVRLATSSSRSLTDTALDHLRDAVVVADARHKQLPVVLANAAARRCLSAAGLIETSLQRWLGSASASTLESMLMVMPFEPTRCVFQWRGAAGDLCVMTDLKLLPTAPGQQLIMLTFAPAPEPGLMAAIDHLPFDLLILDKDLKVPYAYGRAVRSDPRAAGGLLGVSALELTPTSQLHPDVFTHALLGVQFHDDAVEVAS